MITKLTLINTYDFYVQNRVQPKVTKKMYFLIIYEFMQFIITKVYQGFEIKLQRNMGELKILGKKVIPKIDEETGTIKGLSPNWKATKELWAKNPEAKEKKEIIYFFNEHTNG